MQLSRMKNIRHAPIIQFLSQVTMPEDVISFGQGIPFFEPPFEAVNAARKICSKTQGYQYSTDQGFRDLRKIIAEKIKKEQKVKINPDTQIMVTAGANQAFMNILLAISQPADEIIFFTPTYFNYVMAAKMIGCKPIFVSTDSSFQPDLSDLKNKITRNTKAIVTISPNNPTGAVYTPDSLKKINKLCATHSLFHISDEVYEYFIYEDTFHISPLQFDSSLSHTISLFSLSKAFSLSGYRIGYMIFPEDLLLDVLKVQDTNGIAAPSPSQAAALHAIPLGESYCKKFFPILKRNRNHVQNIFSSLSMIHSTWTKGAYYFFVNIDSSQSSWNLAKRLIEKYRVIVLPGEMFDVDYPSFRLSYGNLSENVLQKGLNRLVEGLKEIC
ncbi:MAG: aminotransferase class I/II-fold pyridoxal phosphate-dependent enzyme [Candidatus Thermoplasmatota archaeon]|nr:aminotransferase class I/II-fold pyridoxal phosphate-dependent enzyme [Candidatus Thermoplasmatota archaeon]